MPWDLTGNAGTDPGAHFLGTTDAQPLAVRTGGAERLRVTATGSVGIGTASPAARLDVAGDARVAGALRWSNSALNPDSIELGAPNATTPGTGTPFIDFHFRGLAQDYNTRLINDADGQLTVAAKALRVLVPGSTSPIGALSVDVQSFGTGANAQASHYLRVRDLGAGGATAFCVRGDAHVGIGTAAPQSPLQVRTLTALSEGATAAGAWANLGSNAYFDGAWKRIDAVKAGVNLHLNADDGAGQEFRFGRVEADGANQRTVAALGTRTSFIREGNVGIGHSAPAAKLHVASGEPQLRLDGTGARTLVQLFRGGGLRWDFGAGRGGGDDDLWFGDGADYRLVVQRGTGNVGVGTSAPGAKLDVAGQIWAQDVILTSDARLKADVTPLTGVLGRLQQVRGVAFAWRDPAPPPAGSARNRDIGVIAQEVEGAFPELVQARDGGQKGVKYHGLVALLVEACKELGEQNRNLRHRLDALEAALALG